MQSVVSQILHNDGIYLEARQKERAEWMKKVLEYFPAIDVGIGNGWTTEYLGCSAGAEIWPERSRYAAIRYPHIQFFEMNAAEEALTGYKGVVLAEIIEHVTYEEARHMIQIWANTGAQQIVITTPNAGKVNYDRGIVHNPEHIWFPTEELFRAIVPTNFEIKELGVTKDQDFLLADLRKKRQRAYYGIHSF